ncbi:MAG: hypothetical protein HZA68_08785 [Rhodovulum sp.]|nr:hypothetical protein [Rhodovulum sp.]
MQRIVLAILVALAGPGCAKRADQIAATYVSPYQFDALSCSQLAEEAHRVSARASHVAGVQDEKATRDAVATTVAVVVFWPAAFFVGGNDQQTAELARLRGELEAIEQVSIRKKCGIQFQRPQMSAG